MLAFFLLKHKNQVKIQYLAKNVNFKRLIKYVFKIWISSTVSVNGWSPRSLPSPRACLKDSRSLCPINSPWCTSRTTNNFSSSSSSSSFWSTSSCLSPGPCTSVTFQCCPDSNPIFSTCFQGRTVSVYPTYSHIPNLDGDSSKLETSR